VTISPTESTDRTGSTGRVEAKDRVEAKGALSPQAPLGDGSAPQAGAHDVYRRASERHGSVLAKVRDEVRRVEAGRLASFLIAAIVAALYADLPIGPRASLALAGAAAVVFVVLVIRHRRLKAVVRRAEVADALARLGRLRIWRQWDEIADEHRALRYEDPTLHPAAARDEDHPYVADLDVFGPASLRALLGPTPTPTGSATLREWLSAPAEPDEIARRQSAVRALAPEFDAREALAIEGLLLDGVDERSWSAFLSWLREPPVFGAANGLPRWSVWAARILPPVTLALGVFDALSGAAVSAWVWGAPLALQTALAWWWGRALGGYFSRGSGSSRGLRRYHELLRAWERLESDEPSVRALQARLQGDHGAAASTETRRLERWLDAADSRASMLHIAVAAGLLWDVHVAWGLERWRDGSGAHVEDWFEALGELEALTALATLAHDHPEWAFPEIHEGPPGFEAEQLGHPLLAESVLRTSDVTLDPPGRFLLVTGSNMSGKSTLLRSIGLAAVMAQAGSVVCARRARLTPLDTFTSMRIHDSLTEGVSHFMAELHRLKALVDAADRAPPEGAALLYLIDEVLQGTNSEERRIAARRIVAHLLDSRAIGAVTTHDLTLHEGDRLDSAATKVHFRETVGGGDGAAALTFDYKLRPGLATSRNALKLLEIVGLTEARAAEGGRRTEGWRTEGRGREGRTT
jgi:energy-coupling factor transporter ATP-binding protein EcfA2